MNAMTVRDLLALLDGADPDAEVRLACQPDYPFEYGLAGAREEDQGCSAEPGDGPRVVYLVQGEQIGYATRDLWAL